MASRVIQTLAWFSRQNPKATGFIVNQSFFACPGRMFCHICVLGILEHRIANIL